MNEDDFLKNLADVDDQWDREHAHCVGDTIVSDALRHLGYTKLADAYDRRRDDWWYA